MRIFLEHLGQVRPLRQELPLLANPPPTLPVRLPLAFAGPQSFLTAPLPRRKPKLVATSFGGTCKGAANTIWVSSDSATGAFAWCVGSRNRQNRAASRAEKPSRPEAFGSAQMAGFDAAAGLVFSWPSTRLHGQVCEPRHLAAAPSSTGMVLSAGHSGPHPRPAQPDTASHSDGSCTAQRCPPRPDPGRPAQGGASQRRARSGVNKYRRPDRPY
jgi:hypothetical protein